MALLPLLIALAASLPPLSAPSPLLAQNAGHAAPAAQARAPAAAAAPRLLAIPVAPAETLSVQVSGAGRPVVIVPGIFSSAFGFRRVVPLLEQAGFRPIIIEPLGIGASGRPQEADYSLEAQGRRIGVVMDSLGIGRALVLTQGIASSMALRLSLQRPGLVAAVVSIDGGVAEAPVTPGLRRALPIASTLLRHSGALGRWLAKRRLRGDFQAVSADGSWVTDDVVEGYMAPVRADFGAVLDAYVRMSRTTEPERLTERLTAVRCPVTVLIGTHPHDGVVPPEELAAMRAFLPRLEVIDVPGVGHLVHEERPQAVVDAVVRAGRVASGV